MKSYDAKITDMARQKVFRAQDKVNRRSTKPKYCKNLFKDRMIFFSNLMVMMDFYFSNFVYRFQIAMKWIISAQTPVNL